MSKPKKKIFKYQSDKTLSSIKIKREWDLKNLYYSSDKSPHIEKDVKKAEKLYEAFRKKYQKKDFTRTPKALLVALEDYERLSSKRELSKSLRYFWYRKELNAKDSVAVKRLNLIESRLTKAANSILFFDLRLGKIPRTLQKKYLQDPKLSKFHYYLKNVFENAKYLLSEPEEKILNLKSQTSSGMWADGTQRILSTKEVTYKKEQLSLPEALEKLDTLPPNDKPKLWNLILDALEEISDVAENEFNAIATDKKINDELRGYTKPYSATILSYENTEKSVLALVEAISDKGFKLSSDFYKAKAKFHGEKKIAYPNKYDPISDIKIEVPFETAVDICRDAFYSVKDEYGKIFDRMLSGGQIDVYPKKGKRGGAFMSNGVNQPTLVFLNHTNNFKSLETLAHEVGHAIHAERSKKQPTIYEDFSITTAETASTLFEQLVLDRMLEFCSDEEKRLLLHDKITRDIATIQRQIAFFNFELELHTTVRTQGAVTKEELQKMMKKHLISYLGPAMDITDRDGLSFVYVPHFRYGFYVYTYSYGILVSSIMARRFKENPSYVKEIDTFLTAGSKNTVENIFKEIGIDTTKVSTFNESLAAHEEDIKTFKKLINK